VNQRELPAYYSASDVLVLPGCESWGLVVNEAMACGVPAVVSDAAGCAPDVIEEGGTGWVFPARDVPALAQRLIEFRGASADALRRKCAEYSMARATEGLEKALAAVTGNFRMHGEAGAPFELAGACKVHDAPE